MSQADNLRDAIDARHKARHLMELSSREPSLSLAERLDANAQTWATLAISYELAAGRG